MNEITLKALKASIAHWERLSKGVKEEIGSHTCALCNLFLDTTMCIKCPVAQRTGEFNCHGSPYWDALHAFYDSKRDHDSELFKNAAKRELQFLKSLLPKTNNKK